VRILVVEDEPLQAEAVRSALVPLSHMVEVVGNGEQALRYLRSQVVNAIVLDCHLPRMSGIDVLNWIRKRVDVEYGYGVLVLTSRIDELDVVNALAAGADDFMVKPFRPEELAARVNALLRRIGRSVSPDQPTMVGAYVLDPQGRSVKLRGEKIELTSKEYELVACLFGNVGKVLSRDALAMMAWGAELGIESRSIDTLVYRVRRKMKLGPENGLRLASVYTLGYRLDELKVIAARDCSGNVEQSRACEQGTSQFD